MSDSFEKRRQEREQRRNERRAKLGDLSSLSSQKLGDFASSARTALDLPKTSMLTVEQVRR
jgi:hypothetical protein